MHYLEAPEFLALWAKSAKPGTGSASVAYHPLLFHCLDVGAVAAMLGDGHPALRAIGGDLGVDASRLARVVAFLVALHDIGKANMLFQARAPSLWPGRIDESYGAAPSNVPEPPAGKHGAITAGYLCPLEGDGGHLSSLWFDLFPGFGDRGDFARLARVIGGHHGRPLGDIALPKPSSGNRPFMLAAQKITFTIRSLITPQPLDGMRVTDRSLSMLGWFLSALIPAADWIGSNANWFPPEPATTSPDDYWRLATKRAEHAVSASGLSRVDIALPSLARTLPHLEKASAALSPTQAAALEMPLPAGPLLILIEDATGAGKTETAILLAHRLMAAGHADGLYVGLPTMATANAMYARLAEGYSNLFVDGGRPSLVLAHGKTYRSADFLQTVEGADSEDVATFCAGWIADDRRKALMAQAGAGTIDQALMAALPLKYQSLRLFGLSSKVLIIDEAHAYDPFMLKEIEALLTLHAMLGGSAILLSATLPNVTRARLIAAWQDGRGADEGRPVETAYPLMTIVSGSGVEERPVALAERSRRRVAVEKIPRIADAEEQAVSLASQGACVALIRSTVDAAIGSFERLSERHADTELFHARFLFDDRDGIEKRILSRFGKGSTGAMRRGRILVATQVIEQSLDIDFDALITDLAPIDLLIQRAGRLWRHARGERPLPSPVLSVISPEPLDDAAADWLDMDLPEARWVYQDAALLWRSARRIFAAGAIETATLTSAEAMPVAHVRSLVEAVYGAERIAIPSGLEEAAQEAEGKGKAKRNLAGQQVLSAIRGYDAAEGKWASEAKVRTRLNAYDQEALLLARRDGALIRPLGEDWALSEIRVSQKFARDVAALGQPDQAALRPLLTEADDDKVVLVMMKDESGWRSADDVYRYDAIRGLRRCDSHSEPPT